MIYWLLVICSLLALCILLRSKRRKLEFPGPKGLPIFGCYFSLRGKQMHQVLYDWSMQHGGAFKFSVFRKQFLVLSLPDTLHEMFVVKGKEFGGRNGSYQSKVLSQDFQSLSATSNIALNKVLRKAVSSCLKMYGSGRVKIAGAVDPAVEDLLQSFKESGGELIDPMEAIYRATTLSVYLLVFGQIADDKSHIVQALRDKNEAGSESLGMSWGHVLLNIVPALRHIPHFPPYARLMDAVNKREVLWSRMLAPALEQCQHLEEKTLGKALVDLLGAKYGNGQDSGEVTMTSITTTILASITAGTNTTSTTFHALLNVLHCHPEIQEKIYQEVVREVGTERLVKMDDKERLPYTRATIYEVLRFTSIAPFSIPHRALEDTQLSGKFVPRGTQVLPNLWACHHNPSLWPDPWTFKPERFLDEDGQFLPADHANRKQMFPFGAGTRGCFAEQYAIHRLLLFTANCVQHFHFLPPEGTKGVLCDPRNYKLAQSLQTPSYKLRVVPRVA